MELRVKALNGMIPASPDGYAMISRKGKAAAFDLHYWGAKSPVILNIMEVRLFKLGYAIALPEGTVGDIRDRSGMGSKGIHVFAGVIDEDYRGELGVVLFNASGQDLIINHGDRIAQMLVTIPLKPEVKEVDILDETERGEKGFGSSGK